jgi:hypothetical protein
MGFIPNPNWPPPPGSEDPTERRTAVRVPLAFQLGLGRGQRIAVSGNVSAGGAMFLLNQPLQNPRIDIYVKLPAETQETHVVGELIAASPDRGAVVHRVRWVDPSAFASTAQRLVANFSLRA